MTTKYDVVVVGAGLAGLVAAGRLAGGGWRVLLVDARSTVDSKVHTTGIFVRRTLEDFTLPEDCLGPGIRRVVLRSPAGRQTTLVSAVDEFRVGHMGRLYRHLLAQACDSGVEYRPSTRYDASEAIEGGSRVHLESGGRRTDVEARVIIGADGATSRVARDLGLDENREWIVGVEEVLDGTLHGGEPELHCIVDPRLAPGYIAWVADDGESVHVGVGGHAERFQPAAALAELRARLEADPRFAGLRRLHHVERRGGRIPVNGILSRIGCARGVLIGDAAGAVSPLTAGGLDPCYRLTRLATAFVARVLDGAPPALLAEYSGAPFRRRFARKRWSRRVFDAIAHPLLVELAFGGLRTAPGQRAARRVLFGRGSFPDVDRSLRRVDPRQRAPHGQLHPQFRFRREVPE